jgi:hypothetical protein
MYSHCRPGRHRTKAKLQAGFKKLLMDQRFRNHPKNKGKARKADKKVKTIAGRLVRSSSCTNERVILFNIQ